MIRLKPDELETIAKHVPDAEDACERARTTLSWELSSLAMDLPGVSTPAIKALRDELVHWLQRYEDKLNEAEELLYRTAAAMRQADQTLADNMKEFGLELLGWYDVQRVFGEYDPITGERLSLGDRLLAGGMLLLSVVPPAKGVGMAGKTAITGVRAMDVASALAKVSRVVRYDKIKGIFDTIYRQVVNSPLSETARLFKKKWEDLVASISPVLLQPAYAGVGPTSRIWMNEAKDASLHMIKKAKSKVIDKGTSNVKPKDFSPLAPGGGLAAHEARGGHLIARHVGKTDAELLQRLKDNPKITGASTFKDRATAEKVASEVLNDPNNQKIIQAWLSNPKAKSTLVLPYQGTEIIGRGVQRGSTTVEYMTNAKIVLKKDGAGNFILTGYPTK
ncbi:RNase A-like domain-containing protein [Anoxybacteroides tepidamans]|uniref:RNase A-like domain-containing protein n=1 Tax=Anoxybacteroides tepidamans TaxID=265948 RepID=UPI00068640CA|nr:RNase A-like domain-containing protein [Anoxybacillus tepidamans]